MNYEVNEQYVQKLTELQAIDFTLVELTLYLDTHPDDIAAIEQYNQGTQLRMKLAIDFEASYGPLMSYGHSYSKYPWQWNDQPWPWQV